MLTAAAFALLYLTGCLLALARHPVFGMMTYVLVFYLSPSDRWWGQGALAGVRWSLIAAAVTFLSLAIHRTPQPRVPFLRQPLILGLLALVGWLALQSLWALDAEQHGTLVTYYVKLVFAAYLIYRSIDSPESVRLFLWAHVIGCFYFGWVVFSTHVGGRFDDFGGAGIGDANSGALTIVTGILCAGALFLSGGYRSRIVLLIAVPLMLNAIVATISRSAFLALVAGGLVFNRFSPPRVRKWVAVLSALGLIGFLLLTNPDYWGRIESIQYGGEQVAGVDTGSKRLDLMRAQLKMSREHPMGCGSRCTDLLSPLYLDEKNLSDMGTRSSHNTFLTMLVEHGVPGACFYMAMVAWVALSIRSFWRYSRMAVDELSYLYPAVAGVMAAIIIGDLFVQYPKFEVRVWFLTLGMVLLSLSAERSPVASENARAKPGVRMPPDRPVVAKNS